MARKLEHLETFIKVVEANSLALAAKRYGIAVNSLWPKTTIATQTIKDHFLPKVHTSSRWPSIMADAAYELSLRNFQQYSGCFLMDEDFLRETGHFIPYSFIATFSTLEPLCSM